MPDKIVDASVRVNDEAWGITPNSLSFMEGDGEQEMEAASFGGGQTEQIYSDDVQSKFGGVTFTVPPTILNIKRTKATKVRRNRNVVTVTASDSDGNSFSRTFTQAAMLSDPEKNLQQGGVIECKFKSNKAI